MKKFIVLMSALLAFSPICFSKSIAPDKLLMPRISVQLWSVKNEVKADFKGTLKQIAQMGFSGVEFANEFGEFSGDSKAIKSVLDELGLKGSGAHISFEQLNEKNFDKTVAFYKELGVNMLIVGWDERAWHPEGIKEIVSLLNNFDKKLAPLGMKTGFHNHDHEFDAYEGITYWDYLAQNTSQSVILQQDVGWTTFAGKDPIEYVKRYPGRTLTTHYKVRLPEGTLGKLPIIGQDTIDWLNLSKANIAVGGTLWFVVEQEEYPNGLTPLQAVEQSKIGLDKILKQL
ncbi:sugar phosphate isomerase/epimerase [Colwellia sp. Bg11-12]|uniref:sugar phosphate isomerase/epimerase family protein n=1 Tax=Colwellia sp. Bg11-12 TaxID=2759817 RepID=UPI0015F63F96|nr:sugar phosphate isomerase/epimerase [Colwellia sp. Bg11-12]MBA6264229.1 sugar phosphate isomerase/epimerase [Colwellia sp. Bg11-12]